MLCFADVEWLMLRQYQGEMPNRDYFKDSFADRFNKLLGLASAQDRSEEFKAALIQLSKLLWIRHLLAHNTLWARFLEDRNTGRIEVVRLIKDRVDGSKECSLENLKDAADKARALVTILSEEIVKESYSAKS